MIKAQKRKKTVFIFALIASILFLPSAAGIVFTAIYGRYILMAVFILFTATSFYSMPLLWVDYAFRCALCRFLYAVECECLYTVDELSSQLCKSRRVIIRMITYAISKNLLTGYIFRDGTLIKNDRRKASPDIKSEPEPHAVAVICPFCGASCILKSDTGICDYCNGAITSVK